MASKKSSKSKAKVELMLLATLVAAGAEGLTAKYESVAHLVEVGDAEINPDYGDGGIDADGLCQVRATDQGMRKSSNMEEQGLATQEAAEVPASLFAEKSEPEAPKAKASTGYEIADSVPVPPVSGRGRGAGGSKYPFAALEIGQSFFVPDSEGGKHGAARTMGSAVSIANKRYDGQRKFIVRAVSENGTTGARVWRVAIEG